MKVREGLLDTRTDDLLVPMLKEYTTTNPRRGKPRSNKDNTPRVSAGCVHEEC